MRHRTSLLFLPCLLAFALTASTAQTKVTLTSNEDDIVQLRQSLAKSTQLVVDTTIRGMQTHVKNIASSASRAVKDAKRRLGMLTDSLIVSAQDSLDASRRDSLRVLGRSVELQFASHERATRQILDSRLSRFVEDILKAKGIFSACPECENRSDFEERLADFKDFADSLISVFHDTTSAAAEEHSDLLADVFETARDSLLDVRDGLVDNRLGDIEVWRYEVSRLVLSSAYASHSSYRGRDNGLLQQSVTPGVTYRHSSGLNLQASTSWLRGSESRWDNVQMTGGYDFRLSGVVGGSLSYSHYWFSDSSTSELSVFNDNALAGLTLDWPEISIAVFGSLNFGTASEFTLTTSVAHNVEIPLTIYNKIIISPSFSLVLGQQNGEITTLLTTKGKGKKAGTTTSSQTQTTSTFSVLDYEVSLPATIELGPVMLAPSATYVIPLNVVDASSRKSFVNLEFCVFVTIR